jgi:hypothetical protein
MITAMNSMIVVRQYEGCRSLERMLSVWDEVAHSESARFYRVTIDPATQSATLVIPRGFPIELLRQKLPRHGFRRSGASYPVAEVDFGMRFEPKNRQQEEALSFLLEAPHEGRLTMNLRTYEGKTYVALKHAADTRSRMLVVVHNSQVMKQWRDRIAELTDIDPGEIGMLQGRESLEKYAPGSARIFVAIHRTLDSVVEKDPRRLDRFCREHGIGVKVYDEAHLELKSTFVIDSFTDVPLTLYLTATASRTDWREDRILKYIIPTDDAEKFGGGSEKVLKAHRYHKFRFVNYSTSTPFSGAALMQGRRGFDLNKWAANSITPAAGRFFFGAVVGEIRRLDDAADAAGKPRPQHCILLKTLEQCKFFLESMRSAGFEDVGAFCGLVKDQEVRFAELSKRIFVSTEKSIGTAIDCDIDVMHCTVPMSSKPWFLQLVGRLRGHKMAVFVDYVDSSIEACRVIGSIQMKLAKKVSASLEEADAEPPMEGALILDEAAPWAPEDAPGEPQVDAEPPPVADAEPPKPKKMLIRRTAATPKFPGGAGTKN